jgi:hypothetical protein
VQRSYYQPVTTYRTSTYYQPVTTYRTSYYYQPVTSYRYSCYYDPCTCRYQSVACPTTSYVLRAQCCPVTSYLQRTCCTPVTTYQQAFYYEPVTTCCTTSTGAPVCAPPPGTKESHGSTVPGNGGMAPGGTPPGGTPPGGSGDPGMGGAPPGTIEGRNSGAPMSDGYRALPPRAGHMPRTTDSSSRGAPPARPPVIRFDRIASRGPVNLQGQVVDSSRAPRAGANVLLVSADEKSDQFTLTTDRSGNFEGRLTAGGWLVYTYDRQGKPVFSRRIEVPAGRSLTLTLTQR